MDMSHFVQLGNHPWGEGVTPKQVKKLKNRLANEGFFAPFTLDLRPHILGLDAQYAFHVFIDCAELLMKRGDWTIDTAFDQAMIWRPKLIEFIKAVNDCPRVIKLFGTARNSVVGRNGDTQQPAIPEVAETIRELAKLAVPEGFSLVNGGADSGIMGAATDAWVREMTTLKLRDSVSVFLVPLRFKETNYFGSSAAKSQGLVVKSPPQPAITLRATILHVLGMNAVSVYTPGGFGTLSELAQELEHDELANFVHTAHSHRSTPAPYIAINPLIPGSRGRFFDGLVDHFTRCVAVRTLDSNQVPSVKFITPDNPQDAAKELLEHALLLTQQ